MAIESGILKDNDLIDVSSPIKLARSQTINDKKITFPINLPEVIVYSSNIEQQKLQIDWDIIFKTNILTY